MRIGIVTWYEVPNYGSAFQAYALQRLASQAGHEGVILRHFVHERADNREADKRLTTVLNPRYLRQLTPGRLRARRNEQRKAEATAEFRRDHLVVSEEYVDDAKVDLALIGSDQIFDIRGFKPFQFGLGLHARTISTYAPSFGETTLDDLRGSQHYESVRSALRSMHSLSARDHNTHEIIHALTGQDVPLVLDPTLAYDFSMETSVWVEPPPADRYLVVYSWGGSTTTRGFARAVKRFAHRHRLKTVSVGDSRPWCDFDHPAATPQQFFSLISQATVVVTNMFHGTCFSLRGGVPVIPIVMPHNANKLGSLLKQLGLEDHGIEDVEAIGAMDIPEIDFERLGTELESSRSRSLEYLSTVLTEADTLRTSASADD